MSIQDYLKLFKGICDKLAAIQKPVSDDDKFSWLAIGLWSKLQILLTAIIQTTLSYLFSICLSIKQPWTKNKLL